MPASTTPAATPDRADALVMFGLTGDLGEKKLLPALGELALAGELEHPVVVVSRSGVGVEELRDRIAEALDDHPCEDDAVEATVAALDLRTVEGGVDDPTTWQAVAEEFDERTRPVVYAALPPGLFASTADRLARSDLPGATRLVIEKPFGHDRTSAQQLWDDVTAAIDPSRLLVVDHFLAKTAIENLVTVRTCNAVIANNLQSGLVERIDVLLHESDGVDGRGSFYESVGAVRDVVQNHMLQMLALATMRRPDDDSDGAQAQARRELLAAIEPVDPHAVALGQYEGYRDLDDVDGGSEVETYASLELSIDADPWRGVPVRLETGKALHEKRTAVVFTVRSDEAPGSGRIVFDVSPSACISMELEVLGGDHDVRTITLAAPPHADHDGLGDYATMLRSALRGERRHFADIESILAGWRIVDPIFDRRPEVRPYPPGSTGP